MALLAPSLSRSWISAEVRRPLSIQCLVGVAAGEHPLRRVAQRHDGPSFGTLQILHKVFGVHSLGIWLESHEVFTEQDLVLPVDALCQLLHRSLPLLSIRLGHLAPSLPRATLVLLLDFWATFEALIPLDALQPLL